MFGESLNAQGVRMKLIQLYFTDYRIPILRELLFSDVWRMAVEAKTKIHIVVYASVTWRELG